MATDLKKLAEQLLEQQNCSEMGLDALVSLLERVRKETLEARIEWPSEVEIEKAYLAAHPCLNERGSFFTAIAWLRDKIRLAPVELVSDEKLFKQVALHIGDSEDEVAKHHWASGFIRGYRAAEKKARGE